MYLLNIGLMTNDNQTVSLPWLRSALTLAKVIVRRSAVMQSSTEPTFVAELGSPLSTAQLEQLARDLKQDCIAYYSGDWQAGTLVGPKPWGEFDADQFLLVSGGFLGDALRLSQMTDAQFQEALSMPVAGHEVGCVKRYGAVSEAPCGCVTPDGRPGECDSCAPRRVRNGLPSPHWRKNFAARFGELNGAEAEQMAAAYRAAHPEVVKVWQDQGHYIGLDRPAWDSPLEAGDQS